MYFGTEIVLQRLSSPFSFPATWHHLLKVLRHVITTPKCLLSLPQEKSKMLRGGMVNTAWELRCACYSLMTCSLVVVYQCFVHPRCISGSVDAACSTFTSEHIYPTWLILFQRLSHLKLHEFRWSVASAGNMISSTPSVSTSSSEPKPLLTSMSSSARWKFMLLDTFDNAGLGAVCRSF